MYYSIFDKLKIIGSASLIILLCCACEQSGSDGVDTVDVNMDNISEVSSGGSKVNVSTPIVSEETGDTTQTTIESQASEQSSTIAPLAPIEVGEDIEGEYPSLEERDSILDMVNQAPGKPGADFGVDLVTSPEPGTDSIPVSPRSTKAIPPGWGAYHLSGTGVVLTFPSQYRITAEGDKYVALELSTLTKIEVIAGDEGLAQAVDSDVKVVEFLKDLITPASDNDMVSKSYSQVGNLDAPFNPVYVLYLFTESGADLPSGIGVYTYCTDGNEPLLFHYSRLGLATTVQEDLSLLADLCRNVVSFE